MILEVSKIGKLLVGPAGESDRPLSSWYPTCDPEPCAPEVEASRRALRGVRFLFLLSSLELAGAERQAIHLAAFLKHVLNADVEVWGYGAPSSAAELCDRNGLQCHSFANPLQGRHLSKLWGLTSFIRQVRHARADVLMPYTMAPNILCALTWRLTKARLCVWNQRDEGRGRVRRLVEWLALRQVPMFISNSAHAKEFLIGTVNAKANRVYVVRNGIELSPAKVSRQQWRLDHEIPSGHFVACMVANLHRFKDHSTLLQAWSRVVADLSPRGRGATLLLAGRFDDMTQPIRTLARDLNLGRSVRFLGHVTDIPSLLNAVDLGVFSSRLEGCPNGVLECMAAGLPLLATDIPGIREALGSESEDALSPPGDYEAIASKITRLMHDAALRQRYGLMNRERVERVFGVDRMCLETAALIGRALQSVKSFPQSQAGDA